MSSLNSSILIIGHPDPTQISFGADFYSSLRDVSKPYGGYPVVALFLKEKTLVDGQKFIEEIQESKVVVVADGIVSEKLKNLVNKEQVFRLLRNYDSQKFELFIREALEEYTLQVQNHQLIKILKEQNEKLANLTVDLETRVTKRQVYLQRARDRLINANRLFETLQDCMIAIHRSSTVGEMERSLLGVLSKTLGLIWIRIEGFKNVFLTDTKDSANYSVLSAPLLQGDRSVGQIYFARELKRPFLKEEEDFLLQIADAVSLAIDRMFALRENEELKQQWDATFDAISHPVSIVTSQFKIVRSNQAFAQQAGFSADQLVDKKCFEVLFKRNSPCKHCQLGNTFNLETQDTPQTSATQFQVFSKSTSTENQEFVQVYHNVANQKRIERQILETAKMAELGIISSSIAHELNNPIGGILNFIQLMKMDLAGDSLLKTDLDQMEEGTNRCRDIIQNLLQFTRRQGADEPSSVDIREGVEKALKITELLSRSRGLEIQTQFPSSKTLVPVSPTFVVQGLVYLIQECVSETLENVQASTEKLFISVMATPKSVTLLVSGRLPPDLGSPSEVGYLSRAREIFESQKAKVEFLSQTKDFQSVKITFPRLVL